MPANIVAFRAQCGTFYWTLIAFMAKREQVDLFRSQFKTVSFFPRHCGHQSSHCGLNFRRDCALFYFKYMTYSYSDNTVYKKNHCGNLTTAFVVLFLATFLMQCMDVKSNPGPDARNNWDRGGDYLHAGTETREVRRRSGSNTDRTPQDSPRYRVLHPWRHRFEDAIISSSNGGTHEQTPSASG